MQVYAASWLWTGTLYALNCPPCIDSIRQLMRLLATALCLLVMESGWCLGCCMFARLLTGTAAVHKWLIACLSTLQPSEWWPVAQNGASPGKPAPSNGSSDKAGNVAEAADWIESWRGRYSYPMLGNWVFGNSHHAQVTHRIVQLLLCCAAVATP